MMKFYEKYSRVLKYSFLSLIKRIPDGPSEEPIILDQFVNPFLASSYFISST